MFRSSSFKKRLHEGRCSATSGCDKSDVASRCLQIQGLPVRQGCTRAYVAPVKVITGRNPSDVASRCLQIQLLRQGYTRDYVVPPQNVTGRM